MAKESPCLDCEKRELKCHSTCKEYLQWKKERDEQKQAAQLDNIWRRGIYTERRRKK